jgi:hypothetical protein
MAGVCCASQGCKLKFLLLLFLALGAFFLYGQPGRLIYPVLVFCSAIWLFLELKCGASGRNVKNALLLGVFLMAFDFAVENTGGFLGLWTTHGSVFPVYYVPVEIMAVCILGGMAWALYLPRKFELGYGVVDVLFFSFFGMAGEALLARNGLMAYTGGWTSVHAFFGYLVTWVLLHFVRYRILEV